jgi:tetratricopeptide (TPR) repeat protein
MDEHTERLYQSFLAAPKDENAFTALTEQLFFHGEWPILVEVYEKRANTLEDFEAAVLFHKAGEVSEKKVRNHKRAIFLYRKAVASDHNHQPAVADLRRKYTEIGDFESAVGLMEEEIRARGSKEEKIAILLEMAKIYETQIGIIPKALDKYRQVLDFDPLNEPALANLEKGYRSFADWNALRDLFDGLIPEISDDARRAKILFKLGKLYQNQLNDLIRSARCFELVREANPRAQSIYKELESIYEETQNWASLSRVLREEAGLHLPPEEKTKLLARADDARRRGQGDEEATESPAEEPAPTPSPEAAPAPPPSPKATPSEDTQKTLEDRIASTTDPAQRAEAFLELGRLHLSNPDGAEKARECGLLALDVLPFALDAEEDALQFILDAGGTDALASAVDGRMASAPDDPARARLHNLHGYLLSALPGRRKDAMRVFQQALRLDASNADAQRALEKIWSETGHRAGLTTLYRWQMAKGATTDRRAAALKLASVLGQTEGKEPQAVEILKGLLAENPQDLEALRGLEKLFRAIKDFEALADVYIRYADAFEGQPQSMNALFNVARLYRDSMEDPTRSADVYRRILLAEPENLQASSGLEEALREAGQFGQLADFLGERAARAEGEDKLEALFRQATMLRGEAKDPKGAAEIFEDMLDLEPGNMEVLREIEGIYEEGEHWEDLARVYNRLSRADLRGDEAFSLHMSVGKLWRLHLGNPEVAAVAFEKASSCLPEAPEPLEQLIEIYEPLAQWADLARVLLRRRVLPGAANPHLLVGRAGTLYETKLDDLQKALELFEIALSLQPGWIPALQGQGRIYRSRGDHAMYANRVLEEASHTPKVTDRLARLREAGIYLLDGAPEEPHTREVWEEVRRIAGPEKDVLEALWTIFLQTGDYEAWAEVASPLIEAETDTERAEDLRVEAADIFENLLSRPVRALDIYREILSSTPDRPEALEGIERLSEEAGDYEAARASLEKRLKGELPDQDRVRVLDRLSRVLEEHILDLPGAAEARAEILRIRPDDADALGQVERLFQKTGRYEELAVLLESFPQKEMAGTCLLRAGDIRLRRLADPAGAADDFRRALAADPDNPGCVDSLFALYRGQRDFENLAALLEEQAGAHPSPAPLLEAGLLRERRLGQPQRAADLYRAALRIDPAHIVAGISLTRVLRKQKLFDDLAAALEELLVNLPADAGADAALSLGRLHLERKGDPEAAIPWFEKALTLRADDPESLANLEVLYEKTGRNQKLADILRILLSTDLDDRQKSGICCRLGRFDRDQGEFATALDTYRSALDFVPTSLEALRGVQISARKQGLWDVCIDALEKELEIHADLEPRAMTHRALAILYQEKGDSKAASSHLRKAFEANPGWPELAEDLVTSLREDALWTELVEVLEKIAATQPTPTAQAARLVEAARVAHEEIRDPERAVSLLHRALERDPQSKEALRILGNIHFAKGDHAALIEVLSKEIAILDDGPAKATLLVRTADLVSEKDPSRAARLLVEALKADPDSIRALRVLSRLQDHVQDLPKTLVSRLDKNLDPEQRRAALVRAARAAKGEKALGLWRAVLDDDPGNVETMLKLRDMARDLERDPEAAVWLSIAAATVEDDAAAGALYLELGDHLAVRLGRDEAAFDALFEAWKRLPEDERLMARLTETAPNLNRWEELLELRSAEAEGAPSDEKAQILVEAGRVAAEKLGNPELASEYFFNAYGLVPGNADLGQTLRQHLSDVEDFEKLAGVLGKEYETSRDRGEPGFGLAVELAEVYASRLGNLNLAVEWYYRALEEDSSDRTLLSQMAVVLHRAGKHRDLEAVLDLTLELPDTTQDSRAEILDAKARLYEEKLVDEAMAIDALEALYLLKKGDQGILGRLEKVCRRGGYWNNLADVLARRVEVAADEDKVELLLKLGDLYRKRLGDFTRAYESFHRATELDPENPKARAALASLP